MKYKSILMFGPPGIGKGTQAELLNKQDRFFHFSTGDMFRNIDINSEIGKQVRQLIDNGQFVSDDLTIKLFYDTLERYIEGKKYNPEKQILILDGIPRNSPQTELIKDKIEVMKIISLVPTDDDILIQRILRRGKLHGREDDLKEEVIKNRIKIYQDQTSEVLNNYNQTIIEEIDGSRTIEEVDSDVQKILNDFLESNNI